MRTWAVVPRSFVDARAGRPQALCVGGQGRGLAELAAVKVGVGAVSFEQLVVGAAVVVLVLVADLRGAIGFSSFGVLVYYAVANLAALRQPVAARRWPRALNVTGLLGCLVLARVRPEVEVNAGWTSIRFRAADELEIRPDSCCEI